MAYTWRACFRRPSSKIQGFSTSGSRPHLGAPSDFRGVARLSTNFLKNDIRTEKCWPNSPTYSTDVGVLRGWVALRLQSDILGREAKKVEKHCSKSFDCEPTGRRLESALCHSTFTPPPHVHDGVNKGLGMSSRVCTTGHIKDPVSFIEKSRASCTICRFPPSFIHQVLVITGLNK